MKLDLNYSSNPYFFIRKNIEEISIKFGIDYDHKKLTIEPHKNKDGKIEISTNVLLIVKKKK